MPFKHRCPNQHLLLIKDELQGQRLHCPVCHALLGDTAVATPVTPAEMLTEFDWAISAEQYETARGATKAVAKAKGHPEVIKLLSTQQRKQSAVAANSLLLFILGLVLFFAAIAFWLFPELAALSPWLLGASLLVELLGTVGLFLFPQVSRIRPFVVGTLLTAALRITLLVLTVQVFPTWLGTGRLGILFYLDLTAWMFHKVCLLWSLHLLAEFIEADAIAHDVRRILQQVILLPLATVAWFLLIPLLVSLPLWLGPLGVIFGIITGLPLIGWWALYLIRYIALMLRLRRCLQA